VKEEAMETVLASYLLSSGKYMEKRKQSFGRLDSSWISRRFK